MTSLDTACRAILGARSRQEDAAVLQSGAGTFEVDEAWPEVEGAGVAGVLADGMGGHAGGDIASKAVCELFLRALAASDTARDLRERLYGALLVANAGINQIISENPALSGMGSTLVGFVVSEHGLEWVSVGDSPMYLVRGGEIALLNEDHSLAPALDQLVSEGRMTAAAARTDPRRHMLRSAITGDELDLVDLSEKPLPLLDGDVVIVASDGLQTLSTEEIGRITAGYAGDSAETIAAALLRTVENQREPMQDNVTVVVLKG